MPFDTGPVAIRASANLGEATIVTPKRSKSKTGLPDAPSSISQAEHPVDTTLSCTERLNQGNGLVRSLGPKEAFGRGILAMAAWVSGLSLGALVKIRADLSLTATLVVGLFTMVLVGQMSTHRPQLIHHWRWRILGELAVGKILTYIVVDAGGPRSNANQAKFIGQ